MSVLICKNTPLFRVKPRFELDPEMEGHMLNCIKEQLEKKLELHINKFQKLSTGQNIKYKVDVDENEGQRYLLKIIGRKGYPSISVLKECCNLLNSIGMDSLNITYSSELNDIVPYGYLLQSWIEGTSFESETGYNWIDAYISIFRKIHTIKFPYFGYLAGGPRFSNIWDYYDNMDRVIDTSFGQVFEEKYSIWDLERNGITSPNFLSQIFSYVKSLARGIKSPVQSVLVHGDMFPENLVYGEKGPELIDWDETRAGWWVYEVARNLYYTEDEGLFEYFIKQYGGTSASLNEIKIAIKLEHIRQYLRYLFMAAFNEADMDILKQNVYHMEKDIMDKINRSKAYY